MLTAWGYDARGEAQDPGPFTDLVIVVNEAKCGFFAQRELLARCSLVGGFRADAKRGC